MQELIQSLQGRQYDLVFIDHIENKGYSSAFSFEDLVLGTSELPLSEVAVNLDHNLSEHKAIAVDLDTLSLIKKNGCFKPPSSMLIVSNEIPQHAGNASDLLSDDDIANYLENLPPNALFVDKFEITIDVKPKALKRLERSLIALEAEGYCVERKEVSNPLAVKYRYQIEISGKDKQGHALRDKIIILTHGYSENINDVKAAFNPSKLSHTGPCLFDVLACFRASTPNTFKELMKTSNVTRIDYTIDLVNVQVWQLIFILSNSQYSQTYVDTHGNIETRIEGTKNLYIKAYNLANDRSKKAIAYGDMNRAQHFRNLPPIVRIEVTLRPQKMGTVDNPSFGHLPQFPHPFGPIKFFNPNKLFEQPELSGKYPQVVLLGLHSLMRHTSDNAQYNRIRRQSNKAVVNLSDSIVADQQICHKSLKALFLTNDIKKFSKYCKQLSSHVTNNKHITGADYV